jgi:hypothetical protein
MLQKIKTLLSNPFRLSLLIVIICLFFLRLAILTTEAHVPVTLSGNMLLASNRETLGVCVEIVDDVDLVTAQSLANTVNFLLDNQIPSHARWSELGYENFQVQVDAGCPTDAYLLEPGAAHPLLPDSQKAKIPVPIIEVPSLYRIHLYIVSSALIKQVFGEADLRSAPQEMICEGFECFEVTSALYLTPDEAVNVEILRDRLERVLALNLADVEGK